MLCPCWPGNGSTWRGFDDGRDRPRRSRCSASPTSWRRGSTACGCTTPVTFVGRQPRRHGRRGVRRAPPGALRAADRHLGGPAARRLGHGDPAPAARAGARRLAQRRRRHRHEPRPPARHAHLSRPRRARHPLRRARARPRAAAGRRVPRAPRPALRRAVPGADVPAAQRGHRPRRHRRRSARRVRAAARAASPPTPSSSACPATCCSRGRCRRSCTASCRPPARSRRCGSSTRVYGHDAFLADQDRLAELLRGAARVRRHADRRRRGRASRASAWSRCARCRIGMVGCGTVGRGLLEMIERAARRGAPSATACASACRASPCATWPRIAGPLAAGIPLTDRPLDLVSDPDVDVVVEVAGGTAMEPVAHARRSPPASRSSPRTRRCSPRSSPSSACWRSAPATPLYCEAAAAAALPIIRHLSHRADEVDSLAGILNGTCNFVITRMEQEELPLDEAVAEAQALGFAEADPSADLDGHDAAAKLSILAYRAFGAWVRPDALPGARHPRARPGRLRPRRVDGLPHPPDRAGRAHRRRARHRRSSRCCCPTWHLLASVEEEYNAVYLRCASSGDLSLFGKGAGALPTATAVLGDLIDLAQDNSVRWPVPQALPLAAAGAAARRRRGGTTCASPASRIPGLERRVESLVRRAGLDRAEPRHARPRPTRVHLAFMLSPSQDERARRRCARRSARLARVEHRCASGCSSERRRPLARSRAAARPSARRSPRWPRRRASCTTRSTPTRAAPASPTCTPTSPPCSSTCSGRRASSHGRKARPRSCSPARARWSDLPHLYARYGTTATGALIARLQGARGAPARCWSAIPACRPPRWSSTCC